MNPKHKTINQIIKENGFVSYLEIGFAQGHNFRQIDCEKKLTCDPATVSMDYEDEDGKTVEIKPTSDEFFEMTDDIFDIVFIDGLHEADQVERDIVNSWNRLKIGGFIILHDVNPPSEIAQRVPRVQEQWTGDVWRAFVGFRETYPKIRSFYIPEKYGLGVIVKDRKKVKEGFVNKEISYLEFKMNKIELLGL